VPDLSVFHREFVFIHVVSVFAFLLAHGVSAGVMFWARREAEPVALRSLLKLSESSINVMFGAGLLILASGVVAGFSGNHWTAGGLWVWASLIVFLVVAFAMTPLARGPLNRVRDAVDAGDAAAVQSSTAALRPELVAALGLGAVVVLTWLMMYKPF
jgi:hypothetical protein